MMGRRVFASLFLFALLTPCTAQTALQAHSLPTPQLARLVLGEVGSTVIDVDRPSWVNHCGGPLCPTISFSEQQRRGPAPLAEQGLTFYQKAVPTPGGLQWTGLCSSTALHIFYEQTGRPGQVEISKRFGLSDAAKRVGPAGGPAQRADFKAEQQACGNITSVQGFFQSDDETAAYRAALVSRLFARAAQAGKPLPFHFSCRVHRQPCSDARTIAQHLRVENIRSVSPKECEKPPTSGGPKPDCYEIALRELGEAMDVELIDTNDAVRLLSVLYRVDDVVF